MGRGSSQVRNAAMGLSARQEANANAQGDVTAKSGTEASGGANELGAEAGGIHDSTFQFTPGEVSSFGYTPESAAALKSETAGAAMEPFAGAEQAIARSVARTRNSAGAAGALEASARDKSTAASRAALTANQTIEQARQTAAQMGAQQRVAGATTAEQLRSGLKTSRAQLLAQNYGINANLLSSLSGLPTSSLGAASGAIGRGGFGVGPVSASWG